MPNADPTGARPVGAPTEENVLDLVLARYKHSAIYHQPFYEKIKRYYDLYRGVTTRRQTNRNNIHVPFALSILESDVSRKVQTSFGTYPIVTFVGYSPEDAPNARRNETLISAQARDADSFIKAIDFYTSADIYGTAIARVGWTTKAELEQYREPNEILGGEEIKTRELVTFDGPDWEVLDILDFFPQPGVKRIDDMAWIIIRYHLDLEELERRARMGVYDMSGINALKVGTTPAQESIIAERASYYRSMQDYEARQRERFAKPTEIIEYWGIVPDAFAQDKIINRVISIGNGRVVLRNRPFPFWIKKKPFFNYSPMADPHYLWGIGKIEPIAKLNITANRLASQKLDAYEIFGDPMFITSASAGLNKQNLFSRAGRIIEADSPDVSEQHIRAISPDLRGMQGLYTEIEQLWRWSQQATGIVEDTVMGTRPSSRETATGFRGRAEGVANRLVLEAMAAEQGFLEPMFNYFRALNRQFLKLPHVVKILGSSAMTNPISGFPLPPEPTVITHEDVNMDYRARAMGATQMLSRSMQRQDMMALTGILAQIPGAVQLINWAAWTKDLMQTFDKANIDELLNKQPTQLGALAGMEGGGQEAAITPESLALGGV